MTTPALEFRGGAAGALAPFFLFLVGVGWLGLSGAPDETGFWPVLLAALTLGVLLARDKRGYSEAVLDGMARRIVMLMVLAWILAGVLGTLLGASGLVDSLVWLAEAAGLRGGAYVVGAFLVCVVFSMATGTSLGTLIICAPLLYPPGSALGADPGFLIGALLAGATFGDNVSPISDSTIASATTQGADIGGVVRSRLAYALPAAGAAMVAFALFGGAAEGVPAAVAGAGGDPLGLLMLAVPLGVMVALLRKAHLVEALLLGSLGAALLGLALGRFAPQELMGIDRSDFIATGLLLDGMRRGVGVSVFTVLLMGLVGGLQASGLLDRVLAFAQGRARTPGGAERWIFGSVSVATFLTTHSVVAILSVGELARRTGESAGVGAYRRANILDVTVCTYPFLLPFFIPTVLAGALTTGVPGMPRVSAWEAGLHNVHSWALLILILTAVGTGWGRGRTSPGTPAPASSERTP
jgi:Na+/H+ antiporter NhaC